MTQAFENKTVDFFENQIRTAVEKMSPPEDIRDKLDIGYRYTNRTFEIFEIRPSWANNKEKIESSVVKCRYLLSKSVWKIYWKRANGKWEAYPPNPEEKYLTRVFEIIKNDTHGCFWG